MVVGVLCIIGGVLILCVCAAHSETEKLPVMSDDDFWEYHRRQAFAKTKAERRAIDREYIEKYKNMKK